MKRNIIFISIIVILLGVIGALAYYLMNQQTVYKIEVIKTNEVLRERDGLKTEYSTLLNQYSELQSTNTQINAQIDEQREKVKAYMVEIEKFKGDAHTLDKLKKELQTLRDIMKHFVHQIDSLNTENKVLKDENVKIKTDYNAVNTQYSEASHKNEQLTTKVEIASKLNVNGISMLPIKIKSSIEKESKVKKAERLKLTFNIGKNEVTERNTKEIYIRIAKPDGQILTPGKGDEYAFKVDGQLINYSIKERIDYNGTEKQITTYWKISDELPAGLYSVDVFENGKTIGSSSFNLK